MRFTDWEKRLAAWLRDCAGVPFEWGRHDCCTFCSGAVKAMTGVDRMAEFRGRYATALGAARALKRFGAGTLEATLDGKFAGIAPSLAQRGDIVTADDGVGGVALCVVLGPYAAGVGSEAGREGLLRVARADWRRAWRID
jgi:hypothetical protein